MALSKLKPTTASFAPAHPSRRLWLLAIGLSLVLLVSLLPSIVAQLSALTYPTFTLVVQDVDGNPITDYQFLVNLDNTGIPTDDPADCDPNNPAYPGSCNWPSIQGAASNSPVVAIGDNSNPVITLAPDRYLISVLAPGYKMGGTHVELSFDSTVTVELVQLQTDPLPLSTIRVRIFDDSAAINGQNDIPREGPPCSIPLVLDAATNRLRCDNPADRFHVTVHDPVGENTVDYFGFPMCTEYQRDGNGDIIFDIEGLPIPVPDTGGICLTDAFGDAVVPNLGLGRYPVEVVPPDGSGWIQTSTIEGKHEVDVWIYEGADGFASFEGFQAPLAEYGYVQTCSFGDATDNCPANDATVGTATVTGRALTFIEFIPQINQQVLTTPLDRPMIALNDIINGDNAVYVGRGNPDGTFAIPDVPDGTYQLVLWDQPLDYIIWFQTVVVANGQSVNMGDIGVPRWFGWLQGYVFMDDGLDYNGNPIPGGAADNSVRDCANPNNVATCERGLPGVDLDTRFRDGSIQYANLTDSRRGLEGYYSYDEIFPFGGFTVSEVGFGRFSRTGETAVADYGTAAAITDTFGLDSDGGGLLVNTLPWFGATNYVEWGKQKYASGENGGISGVVIYGVTRNELDPRLAGAEDYEPGIPGVTVRLYDSTGTTLLNEAQTDAWSRPTGCVMRDSNGNPLPDPLLLGPNCIESMSLSGQVRPGVFDGGYAFENLCLDFPTCNVDISPLPPGDYIVEVVPPAGYEIVKEEDQNTDQGDEFIPLVPPAECVGALHLVNDPRNPADGQMTPLCDRKRVTLRDQQNAAADFFLFTQVPIPGRIYGSVFDDLNIETNPNRLYYGEKIGIPNTPVGIRDFTGRLVATVNTDPNGMLDILLPSTHTASCPTPGGICPNVYRIVGNDPGDPGNPNPNYNPNYQTLEFQLDVWPGKTAILDLALLPISSANATCALPDTAPELFSVSQPWISFNSPAFTIYGENFGAAEGTLAYGGVTIPPQYVTWSDTQITVDFTGDPPSAFNADAGARQLELVTATGATLRNSITIHVLGTGYNPTVVTVPGPGGTAIQDAIEAASGNTLIVVGPGLYTESLVLHGDGRNIKLQGVGPGGQRADLSVVQGSVLDGRFALNNLAGWTALIDGLTFSGNQELPQEQLITVLGNPGEYPAGFNAQIDGFRLQGSRGQTAGAIYVNAFASNLEISNNILWNNGGGLGGALTLGSPYVGDNNNDNIAIHNNRITNNGGISLAGGMGIFNGADNYEVAYNDICGNYSGEYGGGLSHFGRSPGGSIHHNRVYYNSSFDEGGGIIIASELAQTPNTLPAGTGDVEIYNNLVQANLANDDGGGIRLLQPLNDAVSIVNNMIVNNVSTDIGGGIALDDASNVTIVHNTIAHNDTTDTAEDAVPGVAQPAGLASQYHSTLFEASNPPGPAYSNPVLVNNIFWNNRAFTWDGVQLNFDSLLDLGLLAAQGGDALNPQYSMLSVPYAGGGNNQVGVDPQFVASYLNTLDATAFLVEPNFVTVIITNIGLPPDLLGDYHVPDTSPAVDAGQILPTVTTDFDDELRPRGNGYDVGADETDGAAEPPAFTRLYFSTAGNFAVPGVGGPFDDADVYAWDGLTFSRVFDGSAAGLPGAANIDALVFVDADTLYMSFSADGGTTVPTLGSVQDEDIVLYDGGVWSLFFDGSDVGLGDGGNAEDVDAFDILADGSVIVSTAGNPTVPGPGGLADEDLLRCAGTYGATTACTWSVYFDGSDVALTAGSENVDGASVSAGNIYLSTTGNWNVPGPAGQGADVFACNGPTTGAATACASFSLYFDGSANGVTNNLDAIDVP